MKTTSVRLCVLLVIVSGALAQQSSPTVSAPRLVRVSNRFKPANGLAASPVESVTLAVYRHELEGDPLWSETQNVTVDQEGNYSVLMGATLPEGVPVDLFATTEPRWLAVRFNRIGEVEQSRVRMVSVPYALKARDAETLGGRPASAYLLSPEAVVGEGEAPLAGVGAKKPFVNPRITSGSPGYLGRFINGSDLGNSILFQSGGRIGLGTVNPFGALHVASNDYPQMFIGAASGETSAAFNLSGSGATARTHRLLSANDGKFHLWDVIAGSPRLSIDAAGMVGIGTPAPGSTLDVAGDIAFTGRLFYQGSPILRFSGAEFGSNTSLGVSAMSNTTTGSYNTAVGKLVLYQNTTGGSNTSVGAMSMVINTTGWGNTSVGTASLNSNTEGHSNVALGVSALITNTTGFANTAVGVSSMTNNTTGWLNTALGSQALGAPPSAGGGGCCNTALGAAALLNNGSGLRNIAIGYSAAANVNGANSDNIHIGNPGAASDANIIRIGADQFRAYLAGVRGVATSFNNAVPVVIDSAGQLGTVNSSRRFKEDIRDMADATAGLMRLRPVTYRYMQPYADGEKPLQYGLIAEEVAEVYPDLVARSADGQIETVKYQMLDSMLLNEVQRQQREIGVLRDELRAERERLGRLEAAVAVLTTQIAK